MRGVLLFAFNNGITDYYEMAVRTAKRVTHYLNLPVSVVTDSNTDTTKYDKVFDKIIITESNTSNTKDKRVWINKGRHKAYDLSPYDETLILDTDYLVNSQTLLQPFDYYDDFMCHNYVDYILNKPIQEKVSNLFLETCWATVIYFRKTERTKQIFQCMEMVQENYLHYVNLFNMNNTMYRNDYSLTIALWIVNGHTKNDNDYIPYPLIHLTKEVKPYKITDTEYLFIKNNKYITMKNIDFHLLDKTDYMEMTNE